MGKILPYYKKAIIDEIINNVSSNTSFYYAFAARSVDTSNTTAQDITNDDYTTTFSNHWLMIFGKKLTAADIVPFIKKNMWASGTVYDAYDNTSTTLYANNNYYVITNQTETGGYYHIYKCIDNNNGGKSTKSPNLIASPTNPTTLTSSEDGYKWRYISSISSFNWDKFSTPNTVPVYSNSIIVSSANSYAYVEKLVITSTGSGYDGYANGLFKGFPVSGNTAVMQIQTHSKNVDYYKNSGIVVNTGIGNQLFTISDYIRNGIYGAGDFIVLDTAANNYNNTAFNTANTTYYISPKVVFTSDGSKPRAYSVVNTSSNSISEIVLLDYGYDISWCNVSIQSNYGSGANVYAVAPSPGGHGSNPAVELNIQGVQFGFKFSNTENSTILANNTLYNKIGIIKNPYTLNANTSKGSIYYSDTFDVTLKANTTYGSFSVGQTVIGANSGARGIVVWANTTALQLVGDNNFTNNEYVAISTAPTVNVGTITITGISNIYTKDLTPLYIQNINNVNRSSTQTEAFKINIQI